MNEYCTILFIVRSVMKICMNLKLIEEDEISKSRCI